MNVVRMQIKPGKFDEWQTQARKNLEQTGQLAGLISLHYVKTGDNSVCVIGRWESEEAIANARPKMIESLDRIRHLLDGDTDPVSGPVLMGRET